MKGLLIFTGLLSFLAALGLLSLGTSLFADFRTAHIAGPGVDVILLDKYPTGEDAIKLEITARGGKKAGLVDAIAYFGEVPAAFVTGDGMDWGSTISGKGRGDESVVMNIDPKKVDAGEYYQFELKVNYVWAKSSVSSFSNEYVSEVIPIKIGKYETGKVGFARLIDLCKSLGYLLLHFFFWYGIAYVISKKIEKNATYFDANDKDDPLVYGLIGNYVALSMIGYWIFALEISKTYNIDSTLFTIFVMLIWCAVPILAFYYVRKKTGIKF